MKNGFTKNNPLAPWGRGSNSKTLAFPSPKEFLIRRGSGCSSDSELQPRVRLGRGVKAFTLSEVLITLTVVGVVSAMTLPVLINKIQDQQFDKARKKVLASVGEAGKLIAIEGEMNSASNAENFVKNYLSKKLKIVKYCSSPYDCGFSSKIKLVGGTAKVNPTFENNTYNFILSNGYSINLFYNRTCQKKNENFGSSWNINGNNEICVNVVFDTNGLKGPNEVGKDIGHLTILYPDETTVAVAPAYEATKSGGSLKYNKAIKFCQKNTSLPTLVELQSLIKNKNYLYSNTSGDIFISSTYNNEKQKYWTLDYTGRKRVDGYGHVRCVKRY